MPATKSPPRLLTVPALAELMGCSTRHVYRLIHSGALDTTDIAEPGSRQSKTRVPETSYYAYIAGRTSNAKHLRSA